MEGKKTYLGLVISALGLLGVSHYFTSGETAQVADLIVQIVGLVFAAYGRKVATV